MAWYEPLGAFLVVRNDTSGTVYCRIGRDRQLIQQLSIGFAVIGGVATGPAVWMGSTVLAGGGAAAAAIGTLASAANQAMQMSVTMENLLEDGFVALPPKECHRVWRTGWLAQQIDIIR